MSCAWLFVLLLFKWMGKKSKKLVLFRVVGPLTVVVLSIITVLIGDSRNKGTQWRNFQVNNPVPAGEHLATDGGECRGAEGGREIHLRLPSFKHLLPSPVSRSSWPLFSLSPWSNNYLPAPIPPSPP
jgi:hypothetical protein